MIQFSETLALKAVSLLLALILFITILGFKAEEIKRTIKLEPLLPPGKTISNPIPSHVQFTLRGPRVTLNEFEKKLQPIRPDLRRTQEMAIGFPITEELLGELPEGVRVVGVYPTNIFIRLEEVTEVDIPVRVTLQGTPAPGYEVHQVRVTPPKVRVSGAKSILEVVEWVVTEPFDITNLKSGTEGVVEVWLEPNQGLRLMGERAVRIKVFIGKNR